MRAGLALLASLAVLAPLAMAAPASVELEVQPPLRLEGIVDMAAGEGVLLLPAFRELGAAGSRLNVTLVRTEAAEPGTATRHHEDLLPFVLGAPARLAGPAEAEVRYLEMDMPEALAVTIWQAGARALLAVGPYDDGRLGLSAGEARVTEGSAGEAGALPAVFADRGGATWLVAEASGASTASGRGTVRALFEGVSLLALNATGALQVDATRGEAGGWTALLRWTGADLRVASAEPLRLLAPRLHLRLDGGLEATRAWGAVTVGDEAQGAAAGGLVHAHGAMEGDVAPQGGALRVRAQGDLAYLTLGEQRRDFAQAAAAGAGLAALAAVAWRFLGVPLYARIAAEELLDNEVRRRVHEHVRTQAGADVKGTAGAVGVSWSTAAYHLARLEREGVLTSRRAGRSKRYFVNGGAHAGRAEAIGALRNPTALAIAELVAKHPGVMQKEIGAALGLPASTVSWHMRRLRALGVVREERRWRRAEYAPGTLWTEVALAVRAEAPPPAA